LSKLFDAEVVVNKKISEKSNILILKPLEEVPLPKPGQFYMLGVNDLCEPLLKRPFSFFKYNKRGIHILFSVRGKGTKIMREFNTGMRVRVIGPLGNGYKMPSENDKPLFIAGGTGIASIYSLVSSINKKVCLIYGASCMEELLLINDIKKLCVNAFICTDDGSFGVRGTVIEVLKRRMMSDIRFKDFNVMYACGPKPMLKALAEIAYKYNIKGYISLEERMACGFGSCLGCAVETKDGYKMVCKDGPVFPIEQILWR